MMRKSELEHALFGVRLAGEVEAFEEAFFIFSLSSVVYVTG